MGLRTNFPAVLTDGLLLIILLCTGLQTVAKEGMWIPATLKAREQDMRTMGLQIPVDQLYNSNGTGLNNAVVLFGRGCTGEIISPSGLILTNHHCGYGSVQGLVSPEKDYFATGFFAKNRNEEIPCPGLTVTFIRRMENVTAKVLDGISDTLRDAARDSLLSVRIAAVEKEFAVATGLAAAIKPYFEGNQYWVAITETFRDIRLVGFPPNGIGAFGGDVENWIWPRHTGDFSMFRVYAGNGNKPADYAATNVPYHTDQFFTINCTGYKEGDFTMVYGFPGYTQEYITASELKIVSEINDPVAILARTRKLDVWTKHMSANRDIFLKYTSKRAGVANGWKKWQGEVMGIRVNKVPARKSAYEREFQKWADQQPVKAYRTVVSAINKETAIARRCLEDEQYFKEAVLGIELIQQGAAFEKLIQCFRLPLSDSLMRDTLNKVAGSFAGFYKNYDPATDKEVFATLMKLYFEHGGDGVPAYLKKQFIFWHKDCQAWAADTYSKSFLADKQKLLSFISHARIADSNTLLNDEAWKLYDAVNTARKQHISPVLKKYTERVRYLDRVYMKAQMEMRKKETLYPNANLTLRLSYGQIKGLDPDGPAPYSFQTTLSEAVALDDTASDIFRVPQKLKELYAARDFGRWGDKGTMPLAFTASNHTSGGNSGSPVLNAAGELIGTNFDRAYEGTMSDYHFDPARCRNISVDIRYTLFIVDKFGGAGWLLDEMNIRRKGDMLLPDPVH